MDDIRDVLQSMRENSEHVMQGDTIGGHSTTPQYYVLIPRAVWMQAVALLDEMTEDEANAYRDALQRPPSRVPVFPVAIRSKKE